MTKRLAVLIPVALVTLGFVTACGGSDDSEPAPTKEEFITQADEICGKANTELADGIAEEFGNQPPTDEEAIAYTEATIIPNLEGQLEALENLTPPEGEEDNVEAITSTLSEEIDAMKADPISSLDPDTLNASQEASEEFGLDNCGGGGAA